MTRREKEKYNDKVRLNLCQIRKGDKVQIVDCTEESYYRNIVFQVTSNAYMVSGTWCVVLAGKGAWDIGCLAKVN